MLPLALAAPAAHPFVGRTDAVSGLTSAWDEARDGPGRLVLIGGEAGAGKTRLAAEFARRVVAEGGWVFYGGCDADLAVPYQPWVQAVDGLLAVLPPAALVPDFVAQVAPLAPLLPKVERRVAGPRPTTADADEQRFRAYGAFAAALTEASSHAPTLLVLDDLHWAGTQTLAVLRHLARGGLPSGLVIVGTFRDTGDEITEPLAGCLADLRRVEGVRRVRLAGLDTPAVERFVQDAAGRDLDANLRRVAERLAERSGGNAFYLCELWRHLEARDTDLTTVPDSVREVVAARLAGLSPIARQITDIAALSGERINLDVVERATGLSIDDLDNGTDELVAAGVLVGAGEAPLELRFAHAIVRDAVAARIPRRGRAGLHRALAEAVEAVYESDRRPVLADLARHFAACGGPSDKVVYYGRRAAALASKAAAYEEAIAHLHAILDSGPPPLDRVEVLLDLAAAQLRTGSFTASRDACTMAFELADHAGATEAVARAAVGIEESIQYPGLPGDPAIPPLRRALALLGLEPSPARTRVLASLGRALALAGQSAEGIATLESAVEEAREIDDAESLSVALQGLSVALDDPVRVLEISGELEELAGRRGDTWILSYATANQLRSLVTLGLLDEASTILARLRTASSTGRFATYEFMSHAYEVVLALAAGDFLRAEQAAERAAAKGAADAMPFDAGVYGLQMFAIRRAQGRLSDVAPAMRAVAALPDPPAMWRPGLAALLAELGMVDEARAVFVSLRAERFAAVARDSLWPACLAFLADTCLAVGDQESALELYDELKHFERQNLMAGMTICVGPADRLLGGLAAMLGRWAVANEHFAAALQLAERSHSPLWAAEAEYDWAVALADRGENERAVSLGRRAITTARMLGIGRLAHRPVPGEGHGRAAHLPDHLSEREAEVLALVAAGRSNREIGHRLFISPNTVANHVRSILRKTGCANRTEASSYAARRGLADE